jgi:drug/metabolite transporter (DMT)-like permease
VPAASRSALSLARVCGAAACWGLAAIMAKYGFERGVPPVRMAAARVAIALIVLLGVLLGLLAAGRRGLLRPPRGTWPLLAGIGASIAAVNVSYYVAIDRLPVGVAISLQYTGPVMLLAWAALVGRRSPGRTAWLACALALAGAVLVSRALEAGARGDPLGIAAALTAAVTFGTTLLLAEALARRGAHPATVLLWGFAAASVIWSVVAPWWSFPWSALGRADVAAAVVGVGIVGTLVPFLLEVGAVKVLPAALAGIALTSEPVFAAGFAWLLLGERLTPAQVAGGALTLAGVALAQVSAAARDPTAPLATSARRSRTEAA